MQTAPEIDYFAEARGWLELAENTTDSSLHAQCLQHAREAMNRLNRQAGDQGGVKSASEKKERQRPDRATTPIHFIWLGPDNAVVHDSIRAGIANLAGYGFLSRDATQQAALRLALGLTLTAAERSSEAPWVCWLGDYDVLHYLITSLWDRRLIFCSGGGQKKWSTFRGCFVDYEGLKFDDNFRSNKCHNPEKKRLVDKAFLDPLCATCSLEK